MKDKCTAVVQGYGTHTEVIHKCLSHTGLDLTALFVGGLFLLILGVVLYRISKQG
jgi:hypothetical protein